MALIWWKKSDVTVGGVWLVMYAGLATSSNNDSFIEYGRVGLRGTGVRRAQSARLTQSAGRSAIRSVLREGEQRQLTERPVKVIA